MEQFIVGAADDLRERDAEQNVCRAGRREEQY